MTTMTSTSTTTATSAFCRSSPSQLLQICILALAGAVLFVEFNRARMIQVSQQNREGTGGSGSGNGGDPFLLQQLRHYCTGGSGSTSSTQQQRRQSAATRKKSSLLFPPALDVLKNGGDNGAELVDVYPYSNFPDTDKVLESKKMWTTTTSTKKSVSAAAATADGRDNNGEGIFSNDCSCDNPLAGPDCCERLIRRGHKMGIQMTERLFDHYAGDVTQFWHQWERDYVAEPPVADYRNVLVVRNIYKSLLSGYLYHVRGSECWMSQYGEPDPTMLTGRKYPEVQLWRTYLRHDVDDVVARANGGGNNYNASNLCSYLATASEVDGMRAYVEWAFHAHYRALLDYWAMAQGLPGVRRRTLTVCYEDLASDKTDLGAVEAVLSFLYGGPYYKPFDVKLRPGRSDAGGHATTKDPELRERLTRVIRELDETRYDGDIAWLDSVLPC